LGKPESEVQGEIVEFLRKTGWVVKVFAWNRSVPKQMKGWFDVVAFKNDMVLLIECKAKGKRNNLREGQKRFHETVRPHTGEHVILVVADDLQQILEIIN